VTVLSIAVPAVLCGADGPGRSFRNPSAVIGASGTAVTGQRASDNDVEIFLNGVSTGVKRERITSPSLIRTFDTFAPFTVSGFVAGANTLTFRVKNGFAPTDTSTAMGLRVEFLSAQVPEPSSFLACGGLVAGYLARRRAARRKQIEQV
jgi:hypothetical protein